VLGSPLLADWGTRWSGQPVMCTRAQCKKVCGNPRSCRCSSLFCSDACFVAEWHAGHKNSCPHADRILQDAAEATLNTTKGRSGKLNATAVLCSVALGKPAAAGSHRELPEPVSPGGRYGAADEAAASRARAWAAEPLALGSGMAACEDMPRTGSQPVTPKATGSTTSANKTPMGSTTCASTRCASTRLGSEPQLSWAGSAMTESSRPYGTDCSFRPEQQFRPSQCALEDFTSVGNDIGTGSFGTVRKVVHKRTAEIFAMKTILKQQVEDHSMMAYIAREISTQLRLQHPYILRLFQYFEDDDGFSLLLEYASGGSLFSLLRKQSFLPEGEAAPIFKGMASALDYLHRQGIVHRDVKPENILMCTGGVAKLADFGWCAEVTYGGQRTTFCGTLDYLSPEMVKGEPHDHTVDVWAMGVLLYEMLVGKPPFAGKTHMESLNRISSLDLQIPVSVSGTASDLIYKLLVRAPSGRLLLCVAEQHQWVQLYCPTEPTPPGSCRSLGATPPGTTKSLSSGTCRSRGATPPRTTPPGTTKSLASSGASRSHGPTPPGTSKHLVEDQACDLLADTAPVPVAPPTQAFAAVTVPKLKLQEVDFGRREPETSSAQRPACHSGVLERLNSIELDAGPPPSVAPAYQEALRTSQLGGAVAPTAQRPAQEHERDISPVRVPALTQPAVALAPWLPPRSGRTSLASQASDRSGAKAAWQSGGTPCHAMRSWVTQDAAPQNLGGDLDRTVAVVAEGDEPRGRPLVQKPRPSTDAKDSISPVGSMLVGTSIASGVRTEQPSTCYEPPRRHRPLRELDSSD